MPVICSALPRRSRGGCARNTVHPPCPCTAKGPRGTPTPPHAVWAVRPLPPHSGGGGGGQRAPAQWRAPPHGPRGGTGDASHSVTPQNCEVWRVLTTTSDVGNGTPSGGGGTKPDIRTYPPTHCLGLYATPPPPFASPTHPTPPPTRPPARTAPHPRTRSRGGGPQVQNRKAEMCSAGGGVTEEDVLADREFRPFVGYCRIDGSTSSNDRQDQIRQFNDPRSDKHIFLISTKAGGVGINLTAASRVVVFDVSWNPSDEAQAIFRAYRYGQTRPVVIYRLVAEGTPEEKIYDSKVGKEWLFKKIVDEMTPSRAFVKQNASLDKLFEYEVPPPDPPPTPSGPASLGWPELRKCPCAPHFPRDRLSSELLRTSEF